MRACRYGFRTTVRHGTPSTSLCGRVVLRCAPGAPPRALANNTVLRTAAAEVALVRFSSGGPSGSSWGTSFTILHDSTCAVSIATKAQLDAAGVEYKTVDYLRRAPSVRRNAYVFAACG
eukprot:SAG11_NODE_1509_length_4774_cov_5.905668_6_plen_119_part_00